MPDRGIFRGIYAALVDDLDFQSLSPPARHTLLTARCCRDAGIACIFRYHRAVLSRQTGLKESQIMACLRELVSSRWVLIEEPILWIRNALRYDPYVRVNNPNHKKAILRELASLPKLQIVLSFCKYYDLPIPFRMVPRSIPDDTPEQGGGDVLGDVLGEVKETPPVVPPVGGATTTATQVPKTWLERIPTLARWPDPAALFDLWNYCAKRYGYPRIDTISPARRTKAKAYLRTFPEPEFWIGTFMALRLSKFLMGETAPANGHSTAFRADLDWLLTKGKDGSENAVKVHDGRYDDAKPRS